jgi:hypothetical protein
MKGWDPPHDQEPLSEQDLAQIRKNIVAALKYMKVKFWEC